MLKFLDSGDTAMVVEFGQEIDRAVSGEVLVLAERIKGSAFTARTREAFARIGVLAVAALILFVTFNDISRMFTR